VADESLTVEIGWRGPWTELAAAVDMLHERRLSGKAVLDLRP
jgi:hypothetical protein